MAFSFKHFFFFLVLVFASSQTHGSDNNLKLMIQPRLEKRVLRAPVAPAISLPISPEKDVELKKVVPDEFPSWMNSYDKNLLVSDSKALKTNANVVVAQDGSGNYKTVNEAITAAPDNSKSRYVIYIKKGVYHEIVRISAKKTSLTLIGDGKDSTTITGNLNYEDGTKTFDSATLAVDGKDCMLQDLGIQNTAGPLKGQAVALRVSGDRTIVYRCHIDGYQDTLYAHYQRQFYRECIIRGTIDFICGSGTAVFQFCNIEVKKPQERHSNVITAQSREEIKKSGFSLHKCKITASSELVPFKKTVKTFLGRPWGNHSTVAIVESYIGDIVDPSGWTYWEREDEPRLSTLTYREYKNTGPGAYTGKRVEWRGYKMITNSAEAQEFTVGELINGGSWLNATGVPYELGL